MQGDKTAPSSDRSFSCLLFAGVPVSACSLRQCQGWCVRTSKLDSGLGNLRTNQWRQYLRHQELRTHTDHLGSGLSRAHYTDSVSMVSSVTRTECQWQICQFWCSSVSLADWSARCYAVSNGPIWGCWTLMPPSVSLFLTVWVCCANKYQPCYWITPPSFYPVTHLLLFPP